MMMTTATAARTGGRGLSAAVSDKIRDFVDCDVHIVPSSLKTLYPYLDQRWVRHIELYGGNPVDGYIYYPRGVPAASRVDAWPPTGGMPGSDLAFMQEQYLDVWQPSSAIIGPLFDTQLSFARDVELLAAVMSAMNTWMSEEWLAKDERLRGSILVPFAAPELAAAEIERWRNDPRFVQVYGLIRTNLPAGNRANWPLYEAVQGAGLPLALHYSGTSLGPISGAGWFSYYLEEHTGAGQIFQDQASSLILEGVFERFPGLKVILIEGGVAWIPSFGARLDRTAELFADELRFLRRRPSEYLADHVWCTSQPIEEPINPGDLIRMLELSPMIARRFMYASDYPHWDFDQPDEVLLKYPVEGETLDWFLRGNARELYRIS